MPAPTYATEIAALETAIGAGELRVEQDGEMVIYQSISDMLKALTYFRGLATAATTTPSATGSFGFSAPGYRRD